MGRVSFVAWLYVAALSGFVIGADDAYRWYEFWSDGQYGTMESADPMIARSLNYGDPTVAMPADVTYITAAGPVLVRGKYLPAEIAKRLDNGEKVPVYFLKHHTTYALFDNEQLRTQWGWFIFGAIALVTAIFAHVLLRKFRIWVRVTFYPPCRFKFDAKYPAQCNFYT